MKKKISNNFVLKSVSNYIHMSAFWVNRWIAYENYKVYIDVSVNIKN